MRFGRARELRERRGWRRERCGRRGGRLRQWSVLPFTRALVSSLAITSLERTVAAICCAGAPNGWPARNSMLEIAPWESVRPNSPSHSSVRRRGQRRNRGSRCVVPAPALHRRSEPPIGWRSNRTSHCRRWRSGPAGCSCGTCERRSRTCHWVSGRYGPAWPSRRYCSSNCRRSG
jgi:hypothetical protein